jgi:hypothetical protein
MALVFMSWYRVAPPDAILHVLHVYVQPRNNGPLTHWGCADGGGGGGGGLRFGNSVPAEGGEKEDSLPP